MTRSHRHVLGACAVIAGGLLGGCTDDTSSDPWVQPPVEALFDGRTDTVRVEVDYMPGAAPYVETTDGDEDLWEFFGRNAERMFQGSGARIEFPSTLDEMEEIPEGDGEYSIPEILDLADQHRDEHPDDGLATFYFVWLDGVLFDDGERRESVLGASIGDTGVLAMFKPVIAGEDVSPAAVARFVEQTTLVHEFGHAVGLVDRGLPLTTEHHDDEHPAHCDNPDCVMYWATGRIADAIEFARRYLQTGEVVVLGTECLGDLDAASMR